jgi:hypothetical protein
MMANSFLSVALMLSSNESRSAKSAGCGAQALRWETLQAPSMLLLLLLPASNAVSCWSAQGKVHTSSMGPSAKIGSVSAA